MTGTELSGLCHQLDDICAPYWFTFLYDGRIFVYATKDATKLLAEYTIDADNPRDYVVTKILLQFSGGTDSA